MPVNHWDIRTKKSKSTGYSDYSISFFDQRMRLFCIEQVLQEITGNDRWLDSTLFDFGCGTGDFLLFFSDRFCASFGFDISEEVLKILKGRISGRTNVEIVGGIEALPKKIDVILSITVLQHILDDDELVATLKRISSAADPKAVFIAMESVNDEHFELQHLSHLKQRKLQEWIELFSKAGFQYIKDYSFYNPYLIPTGSLREYKAKSLIIRKVYQLIRRLGFNASVFNRQFQRFAEETLRTPNDADGIIGGASFSRIMAFRSANNTHG